MRLAEHQSHFPVTHISATIVVNVRTESPRKLHSLSPFAVLLIPDIRVTEPRLELLASESWPCVGVVSRAVAKLNAVTIGA
jgi:hypothetical protein